MDEHIEVAVRDRYNTYTARLKGVSASSTMDAQTAVERLMDKIWEPGTHRAEKLRRVGDTTHFRIVPLMKPSN